MPTQPEPAVPLRRPGIDRPVPMPDLIPPAQCQSLQEVREGVDGLDRQIVELIGARMQFMDAAARIKQSREEVRDERRKAEVIANARGVAAQAGVPDALALDLYERLVEASIAYELQRFDERRWCSLSPQYEP